MNALHTFKRPSSLISFKVSKESIISNLHWLKIKAKQVWKKKCMLLMRFAPGQHKSNPFFLNASIHV